MSRPTTLTSGAPSRRQFLARGAAFLPAAAATLIELAPSLAAAGGGESYWKLVREQFAFRDEKVPMNAANLCPAPRVVAERITDLTRDIDLDCSFQNRGRFPAILERAREKVARQMRLPLFAIRARRTTRSTTACRSTAEMRFCCGTKTTRPITLPGKFAPSVSAIGHGGW